MPVLKSPVFVEVRGGNCKGEVKPLDEVQQERRAGARTGEERGQLSRAQKGTDKHHRKGPSNVVVFDAKKHRQKAKTESPVKGTF